MTIKIGVVGHTSRLGKPLIQRGCIPLDMDITKPNNIEHVLGKIRPHLVVNLAAHSDPDWCENNFDKTIKLNVDAFKTLCDVTGQRQIPVVTLSTDHIFSGRTYFDWKFKIQNKKNRFWLEWSVLVQSVVIDPHPESAMHPVSGIIYQPLARLK